MIILTGATGKLGRLVFERLLEKMPADRIGVSVRDPEKARDLAARGVRVRHGDFAALETLPHAFEGATQLFLVSSNAAATGGDPLAQHRAAIHAAKEAGVERIVYTSQISSNPESLFAPGRDHAATEAMLADSGVAWTALRHGFYSASALMLLGDARETGVLAAPADGKISWTTHEDLAEADAMILAGAAEFDGPVILAGTRGYDLADFAAIASEASGRAIRRETVADDAAREAMKAKGMPEGAIAMVASIHAASRAGEFAMDDGTLETLLGRPATSMRDFLRRNARPDARWHERPRS